jgi:hypothetical protein
VTHVRTECRPWCLRITGRGWKKPLFIDTGTREKHCLWLRTFLRSRTPRSSLGSVLIYPLYQYIHFTAISGVLLYPVYYIDDIWCTHYFRCNIISVVLLYNLHLYLCYTKVSVVLLHPLHYYIRSTIIPAVLLCTLHSYIPCNLRSVLIYPWH